MSKPTRRNFLKAVGLTVGCVTVGGAVGTVIAAPNSIGSSPKPDEYLEQKAELYRQLYSGGSTPEDVINDAIAVAKPQILVQPDYTMNEGDAFIPEMWARQGLAILKENMVAGNLVHQDFSNQIAQYGDIVNCYVPQDFKLTRLTDDDPTIRFLEFDFERVAVPLDAHFFTKFSIRDGEYQQSFKTHVDLHLAPAMIALARCVDLTVMEKLQHNQGAIVAGTEPRDIMLDARMALNEQKCSMSDRQVIIPPSWEADLLRFGADLSPKNFGIEDNPKAFKLLGFDTYTDVATKQGLAFHRQAAAMICRPLSLPPGFDGIQAKVVHHDNLSLRCIMQYNMMKQCTDVTLDMLTGTALLDENLVCRMTRRQDGINMFPTASQMGCAA